MNIKNLKRTKNTKPIKTALITGANGGIGKALCKSFQENGYYILATDKNTKNCICDYFIKYDLAEISNNNNAKNNFFNKIKKELLHNNRKLNVLINNAAIQIIKKIENITYDDWIKSLNVNLLASFFLTQNLLSELIKAKGSVINVGSIHSKLTKSHFTCYSTTKAALSSLTQSMAIELGRKIRINCIAPAATNTPMLKAGFKGKESSFKKLEYFHPTGRIAFPEEIADAALFLASDKASFINGSQLDINGGIGACLHDPE